MNESSGGGSPHESASGTGAGDVAPETPAPTTLDSAAMMEGYVESERVAAVVEVVEKILGAGPEEWPVCALCGKKAPKLIPYNEVWICMQCSERKANDIRIASEAEWCRRSLPARVRKWLIAGGLSERELEATLARIPAPLRKALPAEMVKAMMSGIVLSRGFGIAGSPGSGKTFALSALCQRVAFERINAALPTVGRAAFHRWMWWLSWPEMTNRLRTISMAEDGLERANAMVEAWIGCDLLVIDDLGAERWKSDDWVGSLLDLTIDGRYKANRGTWYTAAIDWAEMVHRYGARLCSRLVGDNPLVQFDGRDLRGGAR